MKASLKWLNKYVDLTGVSAEEIAAALPMLGLEVESVETLGLKRLDLVCVGEILSRSKHPESEHLGVCMVKVSPNEEPLQIVCGAQNYKVGDRVPVALEGAALPTPDGGFFKIKKSKLRGVESGGMMCSARELGLGGDHEGLLILEDRPEIGTSINDVFTDSDIVFEIELTANRGDCTSIIGIARELAARFNRPLKKPELKTPAAFACASQSDLLKEVDLQTPNCPLYVAVCLRDVKIGHSPEWMVKELEAVGLRSINNVVDITNYVMMEYGQPLHAFSAENVRGKRIAVRMAKDGEEIKTLDGKKHRLASDNMVICDGDGPVAIAGVMGGENSEVHGGTSDIILESAYFVPGNVRGTSRRLNINTDSSYRFVRDVDPQGTFDAARRAADLIVELAGARVEGDILVAGKAPRGDRTISLSYDYVIGQIGFKVEKSEIENAFASLGFGVGESEGVWSVIVPSFRSDVYRPVDLVEEFIRVYGSSRIPEVPLTSTGLGRDDDNAYVYASDVANMLSSYGLNECQHYTLCDGKLLAKYFDYASMLRLDNPLTSDQDSIRPTLMLGLMGAVRLNLDNGNVFEGLFENGRVFRKEKNALMELVSSAFVIPQNCGRRIWKTREAPDFFTAKKLVCDMLEVLGVDINKLQFKPLEDPLFESGYAASCAMVGREGFEVRFGALNLAALKDFGIEKIVYGGEIVFKKEVADRKKSAAKFVHFSQFPASVRDVALVVPHDAAASDIVFEISKIAKSRLKNAFDLESIEIFDVYSGRGIAEGAKSLGFSLTFRSFEKTLKTEDVNAVFDEVCVQLDKKYQVRAQ